ncbi:SDR family oxidoreductase [Companilactobacillus sp. HBUAS56275]|uniref:SDR family oxidoreductase n=1 Tax=Candidatus Companilactobacillus pullicola TaxID=2838523 RepID=A0A9D1ZK90_9LACO|nr:SDR family oxidoreductase [Candidatus Companilactobacillus pullicola]
MRVFMTGATGYIGTLVAQDLINNGIEVLGLTRSQRSADKLTKMGGVPVMGTLEDIDTLKTSAQNADAVLHLGFVNDFEHFAQASRIDAQAIESFGEVLNGTDRPLIVTAGTAGLDPNHVLTEKDTGFEGVEKVMPRRSEFLARELVDQGINAYVVRLAPSVHGNGRYGIISMIIAQAQKTDKVPYFGDGQNRWNAVNYQDAAKLFVKALDYALSDNHSLHIFNAVGEGQTKTIEIAKVISQKLNLPLESQPNIDFDSLSDEDAFNVNNLFGLDIPADSKLTQKELNWQPINLSLIADLEKNL